MPRKPKKLKRKKIIKPIVLEPYSHIVDYHYLFNEECRKNEDLKRKVESLSTQRFTEITEWIRSVATVNDAIAHAIGEGIDNARK